MESDDEIAIRPSPPEDGGSLDLSLDELVERELVDLDDIVGSAKKYHGVRRVSSVREIRRLNDSDDEIRLRRQEVDDWERMVRIRNRLSKLKLVVDGETETPECIAIAISAKGGNGDQEDNFRLIFDRNNYMHRNAENEESSSGGGGERHRRHRYFPTGTIRRRGPFTSLYRASNLEKITERGGRIVTIFDRTETYGRRNLSFQLGDSHTVRINENVYEHWPQHGVFTYADVIDDEVSITVHFSGLTTIERVEFDNVPAGFLMQRNIDFGRRGGGGGDE